MSYNTNEDVYEALNNGIAGVENGTGTMETRGLEDGSVELVGYGWMRYGVWSEGEVTVFEGWYDKIKEYNSQAETTPRHIREVKKYADEVESRTPQIAPTPDSVREVGHYGGYDGL